jgi:uncharacterized repeat protein (TIGR04042 family)
MPEIVFDVEWPDGSTQSFYSPSLIVEDYFTAGTRYPLGDFVGRSREAMGIASDRVQAKYGFPCSRAAATLAAIERAAEKFDQDGESGPVTVRGFRR